VAHLVAAIPFLAWQDSGCAGTLRGARKTGRIPAVSQLGRKEDPVIDIAPESKGNILVISATGKLTDRDYKEVLIPRMDSIIREHGKARLLLDVGKDFHGWEAGAAWDDARFGLAHRKDFEKLGVIGGPKWVEWGVKIGSVAISGEVKTFSAGEREQAVRWINN
jgi:hypothetical protein